MKKTLVFLFLCLFLFTSNIGSVLAVVDRDSFPVVSSTIASGTSQTGPAVIVNYSDKNYFVPNKTLG